MRILCDSGLIEGHHGSRMNKSSCEMAEKWSKCNTLPSMAEGRKRSVTIKKCIAPGTGLERVRVDSLEREDPHVGAAQ